MTISEYIEKYKSDNNISDMDWYALCLRYRKGESTLILDGFKDDSGNLPFTLSELQAEMQRYIDAENCRLKAE